ncbi:MAG: hypothetical protein H6R03_1083 [Burkholderiaceae bacterium]|nr:hypothetical protein [Burkholderiaceae bacterium]
MRCSIISSAASYDGVWAGSDSGSRTITSVIGESSCTSGIARSRSRSVKMPLGRSRASTTTIAPT